MQSTAKWFGMLCFTALCWKCSGERDEVSQLPLALTHRPPLCVVTAASVTIETGKASGNAA